MQVFQFAHFYREKPFTEQSKRDTTNNIQIHILKNSYACNKRLKYVYIQVHVFAHLYMLLLSI